MTRAARPSELLIGIEGLALLRHLHENGEGTAVTRRLWEIEALLDGDEPDDPVAETDPRTGYGRWAARYDEPNNPIIALEQPVVWSLLDGQAPGRTLDAACGTGRHAGRLVALGHETLGVDLTPEMLVRARAAVPRATFAEGDLRALPASDGRFDVVVCALALAHLPSLESAVAELARVLAPGGRLVISVLHPVLVHLGWHAAFTDADGRRGFVREHAHGHGDYLRAFRDARLRVRDCIEPRLRDADVTPLRRAFTRIPEATVLAYVGLPAVLVWSLER